MPESRVHVAPLLATDMPKLGSDLIQRDTVCVDSGGESTLRLSMGAIGASGRSAVELCIDMSDGCAGGTDMSHLRATSVPGLAPIDASSFGTLVSGLKIKGHSKG